MNASEAQDLRKVPPELITESVAQRPALLNEVLMQTRQFAELDEQRFVDRSQPEGCGVRSQRVGENERVPAIVLGTRGRMPIAEPVELLGVDREDADASDQFPASPSAERSGSRGARSDEQLRAIAERAPKPARDLYRVGLLGQKEAAKLGAS